MSGELLILLWWKCKRDETRNEENMKEVVREAALEEGIGMCSGKNLECLWQG